MTLPRLIVTGASGFVGRNLLEQLKDDFFIYGLARRSQAGCGAPIHPNITWRQVDIGDRERLSAVYERIRREGGADWEIHLAAHYDFDGHEDPEYRRTNVEGLRNVLDLSVGLGLRRFLFASSVAACRFPPGGGVVDECSPPDGEHILSRTKAIGEAMVREYREHFPAAIVRFAALFSDWCEYPPLFVFLGTWLSRSWRRRILGGKGRSAVPYMHVGDVPSFVRRVLERHGDLEPDETLIAGTDGCTSHRELFESATLHGLGYGLRPIAMPRRLCAAGVCLRDLHGRLTGRRPFERLWMMPYIDRQLRVDAGRTRRRLDWSPRRHLEILRRMPFLIERRRSEPIEWNRRNLAALRKAGRLSSATSSARCRAASCGATPARPHSKRSGRTP